MKITGELLKTERLKQGISVADVASSLKLSSRIISSIEAGDSDELPAKTFIRGFVKSYAQLLKLDTDLILRQFLEEMGSTQPLPKTPPPQTVSLDGPAKKVRSSSANTGTPTNLSLNQDSQRKTIFYISIASGLLVLILIINNVVEKYQKESIVDKKGVDQVQPLKTVESVLPPNEVASPALKDAESPTAAVAANTSTEKAAESKLIEKPSVSDLNVVTSPPPDFEPSAGKPVELIVIAKKDTDFFYAKGNSKNFIHVKLASKEVQVIRSSAGLHLKTDDGSSLSLILNGLEKGQASSANKPIRLTF